MRKTAGGAVVEVVHGLKAAAQHNDKQVMMQHPKPNPNPNPNPNFNPIPNPNPNPNDKQGLIVGFDTDNGRYVVQLEDAQVRYLVIIP